MPTPPTGVKGRLKDAQLPFSGRIRFVPPENTSVNAGLLRGPRKGYIDRFGNEWIKGPSRTAGQRGRKPLERLAGWGDHSQVDHGVPPSTLTQGMNHGRSSSLLRRGSGRRLSRPAGTGRGCRRNRRHL
ncbi:polymorphic toxin type 17 domain-containing protein [Streptomyces asiaticus]